MYTKKVTNTEYGFTRIASDNGISPPILSYKYPILTTKNIHTRYKIILMMVMNLPTLYNLKFMKK